MSDDPIKGAQRNSSEPIGEKSNDVSKREKEKMLRRLQQAAEELGKSPTIREYRSLDFEISADDIKRGFGTWNEAKEAANLKTVQRGTIREINEEYFKTINTLEKSYWLGTLFGTSSLQAQEKGTNHALRLGRVEEKGYFVTEFAKAVESGYPIGRHDRNESGKVQVHLQISNPEFVDHLRNTGYSASEEDAGGFPEIDERLHVPFVRGFLESSGYFSVGGWNIKVANVERAEKLQNWFKEFGAKRPTISEDTTSGITVNVANVFDIRSIFETLYPDLLETDPCYVPYAEKIMEYLQEEYPYPENTTYLRE